MAEKTACEAAFEHGIGRIFERCQEEGSDTTVKFIQAAMGLHPGNTDCSLSLEEGLTEDVCSDPRSVRKWVVCRVLESPQGEESLLVKNNGDFKAAMEQAWNMARSECPNDI